MNVNIVQRRASVGSLVPPKPVEEAIVPASSVQIQPLEFASVNLNRDIVPYQVINGKKKAHRKRRTGCCSKMVSEFVMLKSAYPCPDNCSSPAEVLLKSFTNIIRKESFWTDDVTNDNETEHQLQFERKPADAVKEDDEKEMFAQTEAEERQDNEADTGVKEVSEAEEVRLHLASANVEEKMTVLIQCVPLTRIVYGDHSFDHAEALVNLAQAYLDWKKYFKQAIAHCKTARAMLTALHSNDVVQANEAVLTLVRVTFCRLLLVEGRSLIGLKSLNEAEKVLEKAKNLLEILKKLPTLSESHLNWFEIRAASAFAQLYICQERYGQAASSVQTMLDVEKKKMFALTPVKEHARKEDLKKDEEQQKKDEVIKFGGESPHKLIQLSYYATARRVFDCHCQLAQIEEMRGQSADSKIVQKWYKNGIEVLKAALDHEPPVTESEQETAKFDGMVEILKLRLVNGYFRIAKCLAGSNQIDMAESNVKKALRLFEDSDNKLFVENGKSKKVYHIIRDELAKVYVRSQKHEDAISLLTEGLTAKKHVFGDFSLRVMETYNLLASLYLVTGNVEKAVASLKKYLAICSVRYGASDPRTKTADQTINMLLAGQQGNERKPLTFKTS